MHGLVCCDTTSKVIAKKKNYLRMNKRCLKPVILRWKNEINENLIANADKCLLQCVAAFYKLYFNMHHKMHLKVDI